LTLHAGKIYSFPLHISRVVIFSAVTASRRRGNDLGTTINKLRKTTSVTVGIGLGTTVKHPQRTTGAAAGSDPGTTRNYLRGALGKGRAQRPSKYLRCTTSAAANNGLGTTIKYLVNLNAGAGSNLVKAHIPKNLATIQMNPL
jgi:hypothetical protein